MDENIICVGCGNEFVFTAGEQEFYEQRGFTPPKRCKKCREKRERERKEQGR